MKLIQYIFLFLSIVILSEEIEPSLESAQQAYRNGEFELAIINYQGLLNQGYENYEIYYNLGNSYYKLNQIANSILNYEKAKKLNPSDEDIDFNLNIAKLQTIDKIEPIPELFLTQWYRNIVGFFSSDNWFLLSILAIILSLISFILIVYLINFRKLTIPIFLIFIVLSLISIKFGYDQLADETDNSFAIIMNPTVYVKSAPSSSSTDLFILHEGTKIQVVEEDRNWQKIKLADGNEGWITEENISRI